MITAKEKELVNRVCDMNKEAALYVYHIREICRSAKELDYLLILKWFIDNKLTGSMFVNFVKIECNQSPVHACAIARKYILKDNKIRQILAR